MSEAQVHSRQVERSRRKSAIFEEGCPPSEAATTVVSALLTLLDYEQRSTGTGQSEMLPEQIA